MESNVNKVIYKVIRVSFTIMVILLLVYGTMRVSFTAYDFGYRVFTESAIDKEPGRNVTVTITAGMGSKDIAAVLFEKGLIRDETLFVLQYKLSAYADEIIPGTYMLSTAMTPKEMIIFMSEAEQDTEAESSKDTEK